MKSEDAVDDSTVTRWLKKIFSGCKRLNDQARASWPKNVDSKATLQATEENLASNTQRVSGELDISQSSVVCCLYNLK